VKISESIRQTVIRLWLENNSRKDIAVTCGVSEGTVSNIVSDWRQKLGDVDVEALRELGSNLKRCRIDAVRCAQGFRISMIMRKMGIN
jgi:DNA-binding CsgD family transcriptional regulator